MASRHVFLLFVFFFMFIFNDVFSFQYCRYGTTFRILGYILYVVYFTGLNIYSRKLCRIHIQVTHIIEAFTRPTENEKNGSYYILTTKHSLFESYTL